MGCQLHRRGGKRRRDLRQRQHLPRGEAYAKKECVAPARTVTGTVAIEGAALPVLWYAPPERSPRRWYVDGPWGWVP